MDAANGMNESMLKQSNLEEQVVILQNEKDTLERSNKELRQKVQEYIGKLKKAEEAEQRLKSLFETKLKKTIQVQEDLVSEMKRIHDDASLLPQMFRLEANERNIINKSKNEAEVTAREALANRDRMQSTIDDLQEEVDRKKKLSIQAIAARSNVKRLLDQAQAKNLEFEKQE